jgi:hypothetical protein
MSVIKETISIQELIERLATGRARELRKYWSQILLFLFLPVEGAKVKLREVKDERGNVRYEPEFDVEGYPAFAKQLIPLILASNLDELKNGDKNLKRALNACLKLNLKISILEQYADKESLSSLSILRQYANTNMLARLGLSTDIYAQLSQNPLFYPPATEESKKKESKGLSVEMARKLLRKEGVTEE